MNFVAITESGVTCGGKTWYSSGDLEKLIDIRAGVLLIITNRNFLCYYARRLTVLNNGGNSTYSRSRLCIFCPLSLLASFVLF